MLDVKTRQRIDTARDILVGKVPDPKSQVEQITLALMYKFMDDMDAQSEELGGKASFFTGTFESYSWRNIVGRNIGAHDALNVYSEGITRMSENPEIPQLFRQMFNNAYLPYRDPETLRQFLQVIDEFEYDNSERLGDAFEYLLSIMGSQGDAGQFRTPRHIIDFIVEIVNPKKDETILDPACGTAGFLISAYKHIASGRGTGMDAQDGQDFGLTPNEKTQLAKNVRGYDISPDMVQLSLVNLYLHGFAQPDISEYDTLTSEDRWNEYANVILANPPFMSPKGGIRPHNRFSVKAKRSEVLFVDYIAGHLTPEGRAGVIVPEGIISRSQNAHKQLRKMLVEDYLVAVISLPPGVFNPYSGVKTSILILDKSLAKRSETIGFFKVENDGFDLGAQRRPIERDDLPRVKSDVKEYLRLVREGICMDGQDEQDDLFESGLVVAKERIAEDGEFNLGGERYRVTSQSKTEFPQYKITDLVETLIPPKKIPKTEFGPKGKYPIIDQSQHALAGWTDDDTALISIDVPLVIFGDHTCEVKIVDGAFAQGADGIKILKTRDLINPRFLYQVLRFKPIERSGYRRHFAKLKELEVPVPPLEVQREVVSEIEGYQRVIDGARMVVENWRPRIAVDPAWPLVELGEVSTVQSGFGFPKVHQGDLNNEIPFLKVSDMNLQGNETEVTRWNNSVSKTTLRLLKAKSMPKGTVIFPKIGAAIATNKKRILTCDSTYDNNVMGILPKNGRLLPKYLHTHLIGVDLSHWASQAQPPSMRKTTVERYRFSLPPIPTQEAIVAEIAAQEALVDANRQLIKVMESKVQEVVGRVWND